MSSEDLEKYETEMELQLYREYRDVVSLFTHVVETERRFYLCNQVDMKVRGDGGEVFFDVDGSPKLAYHAWDPSAVGYPRGLRRLRIGSFSHV